eukprot:m.120669 g.120669  ORF g.120669 m.120669 type:complete len:185 (-) comp17247_c0_seq2:366-920(-)
MAAVAAVNEAKRQERRAGGKLLLNRTSTTDIEHHESHDTKTSCTWNPHETAKDGENLTSKPGQQYATDFPLNANAPIPKGTLCPTRTSDEYKPYARVETTREVPGKKAVRKPQDAGLGPGFTIGTPNVTAGTARGAHVPDMKSSTGGPSVADQYMNTPPAAEVQQHPRYFRPHQSCDRSYNSQW